MRNRGNCSKLIDALDRIQLQRNTPIQLRIPNDDSKDSWEELRNILDYEYYRSLNSFCETMAKDSKNKSRSSDSGKEEDDIPIIPRKRKRVHVEITKLSSLQDLIDLIDKYPEDVGIAYDVDLSKIRSISRPLRALNSMIGLDLLKQTLVDQILYFAQDLHKSPGGGGNMDYMHTVLYGPPGTGKTEVAMLMGKIYASLGILKKGSLKKVTRSDLVAGYLGQTAIKTRKVINEALDGILFIDEAYSLGNAEKRDSFAQECIDTICESASHYKDRLVIIIAGYEEELRTRFFAWNAGLESRFPWRHHTSGYSPTELSLIFRKMVHDSRWNVQLSSDETSSWFEGNKDEFKFYGRDMETLLSKVKISHAHRVFGKKSYMKRNITSADLTDGLTRFKSNKDEASKKDTIPSEVLARMYT
jgi:hypothetical protein